jgi:hypothetical protein
MRGSLIRGLALTAALLTLASCNKTKTAADVDTGVQLLDHGDRPRHRVRYKIPPGKTTSSTTTFRVRTLATSPDGTALSVLPGLRVDIVSGPAEMTERGVKFKLDVVKAEALVPAAFDQAMADMLRDGAAIIDEAGGWIEVDDRGRRLAGDLDARTKRSDVPMRLLRMIVNARETLSRVLLPEEPIGLGARWETRRTIDAYGFEVQQVNTYTLVDRVGDELMLNVTVQQRALPQTISFPEDGIEISVESISSLANGQIVLDLDALESDASANGSTEDRIIVKTVDGEEPIRVDESFEIQVANTSGLTR